MQLHFMKLLPKAPVRKPCWHSIRTKSINNICRTNFITHRIKIKTHTRCNFRYLINGIIECLCFRQYDPSKVLFIVYEINQRIITNTLFLPSPALYVYVIYGERKIWSDELVHESVI